MPPKVPKIPNPKHVYDKAKAYVEGYRMMGRNAVKSKAPTEDDWFRFEKKMHKVYKEKKQDARIKHERKQQANKDFFAQMVGEFAPKEDPPGYVRPFKPLDIVTIMGLGASLGTCISISLPGGLGMFAMVGSRVGYRKLKYMASHHPNDLFGPWPLWPKKYEEQRVKLIQKIIIELAMDSSKVRYHHGHLDSPENFYGETDFRKPKSEDQKESNKQGVGQLPPSEFFDQAMEILWDDERCKDLFGPGFGGQEPERVLRRTGGEIDIMQMSWVIEGTEGSGKVQVSVVRNLLDSILVQSNNHNHMDFMIKPQTSSYTHLTHGANVHEDWDISTYY